MEIPVGKNLCDEDYFMRNGTAASYNYVPIYVGKGNKVSVSIANKMETGILCYCVIGYERTKGSGNGSAGTGNAGWMYHKTLSSLCR